MSQYKVLIADYSQYDSTGGLPSILYRAGASVDVFCDHRSWLLKNRYWNKWIPADLSKYSTQLQSIVQTGSYDWVILGDDATIRIMNDAVIDEALFFRILPLSKIENRVLLGSKMGLSVIASKYSIATPTYHIYSEGEDVDTIIRKVGFPFVAKIDQSSGGSGVFLCKDRESLGVLLDTLNEQEKKNLVFQKYIVGTNIAVEALYRNGVLVAYIASRVLETFTTEFSPSMRRMYGEEHAIESILEKIGDSFGLNGFSAMTFMYDENTKTYLLIEVDMRPQAWFGLAKLGGVDFSKAAAVYLTGAAEKLFPEISEKKPHIVRHFPRDIVHALTHGNVLDIAKWCFGVDGRWRSMPFNDLVLLWAIVVQRSKIFLKKGLGI